AIITKCWECSAVPPIRRSRAPIASWRYSFIRTAIPIILTPKRNLKNAARLMQSWRTPRSAECMTGSVTRALAVARRAADSIRRYSRTSATYSASSLDLAIFLAEGEAAGVRGRSAAQTFAKTSIWSSKKPFLGLRRKSVIAGRRTARFAADRAARQAKLRSAVELAEAAGRYGISKAFLALRGAVRIARAPVT